MKRNMWWSSSSGRIELKMTLAQARSASHSGQCDADVLALSKAPNIAKQFHHVSTDIMALELREYGAWDADQLNDREENIQRLLWLAAGDICEENIGK